MAAPCISAYTGFFTFIGILPANNAFAEETATTNAKVHLRKSADKDSTSLQTLPEGEEVTLLSTSGSWYKVRYGKYTGYIMKQYITTGSHSQVNKQSEIDKLGDAPGAMRIGDSNSDVKKLQQALKLLGYYNGKLDGDYGDGTTKAVMEYQGDHNLQADGVAGKDTVTSIFRQRLQDFPDEGYHHRFKGFFHLDQYKDHCQIFFRQNLCLGFQYRGDRFCPQAYPRRRQRSRRCEVAAGA